MTKHKQQLNRKEEDKYKRWVSNKKEIEFWHSQNCLAWGLYSIKLLNSKPALIHLFVLSLQRKLTPDILSSYEKTLPFVSTLGSLSVSSQMFLSLINVASSFFL